MISTNHIDIFNLSKEKLDSIDKNLNSFLNEWKGESRIISTNTSGSTGKAKKINLEKKHMIASGNATIDYFNLQKGNTFLVCLPISTIGGKMMLLRALLVKGEIIFLKPNKNPIKNLDVKIDFCALTPMQLANSLDSNLNINCIDKLIIGGGQIHNSLIKKLENLKTKCYHTFGMTETISHIAIRKLNQAKKTDDFKCLNHIEISVNNNSNLVIISNKLGISSITTNDIVKITGNKTFKWLGRSDNIINSGGVKISPESIENELSKTLPFNTFFTTSIADSKLGEKLILISNYSNEIQTLRKAINSINNTIFRPKYIYIVNSFEYTLSNKINRKLTKQKAIKSDPIQS
jgi:o-succinylbenzoate---CoA ligase